MGILCFLIWIVLRDLRPSIAVTRENTWFIVAKP